MRLSNWLAAILISAVPALSAGQSAFQHFEARQTHPLAQTPGGARLLALNSTDGTLSIFTLGGATPALEAEIPVGLEPVSVRARTDDEVWVVNEVSDSVSIVSISQRVVVQTLAAADEPADVAFAGGRAFVTCARNRQVRVYDVLTRQEVAAIPVQADMPRALTVNNDGTKVYAASLLSGNRTTILPKDRAPAPPAPTNAALPAAPQTALIVPAEDARINYEVLDNDVVEIDVATLSVSSYVTGLGTHILDLATHPISGELWAANTEALNLTRFEPNLRGHFAESRISRWLPAGAGGVIDLNAGTDYSVLPNEAARATALAQPMALAFTANGDAAWVAAFASDRIARVNAASGAVEARIDIRTGADTSAAAMRGPRGLALDDERQRLYVLNKLFNTVSVIDTASLTVIAEMPVGTHDTLPRRAKAGRSFLFDARLSGNGTVSCGICHMDADRDGLAWDLGDPGGEMQTVLGANLSAHDTKPRPRVMHPMKGPMVTQTLRGMREGAPFHWRGDRATIADFNPTFDKLMGGAEISAAAMADLTNYLETVVHHPNPNRNLDRGLPTSFGAGNPVTGRDLFNNHNKSHCAVCHLLPTGSDNNIDLPQEAGLTQPVKNPPLRTVYQRFHFDPRPGASTLTGFGLLHDGAGFSLPIVHPYVLDTLSTQKEFNDVSAFLMCFDTGTAQTVGFSRTVTTANRASATLLADLTLLEARAAAGDCDVVARGALGGQVRSLRYVASPPNYKYDKAADGALSRAALLALLTGSDAITFMGVPPGAGARLGGDWDEDGVLNADDLNHNQIDGVPRIVVQPRNTAAAPGGVLRLSVEAEGPALTYQWYKGTSALPGQTGNVLDITSAVTGDAGTYTVKVINPNASVTSDPAVVKVYPQPVITAPPVARTVNEGQTATFSVTATGSELTYQWYRGATAIQGAEDRTLNLLNVAAADMAIYSVVVANGAGSVSSAGVALSVVLKPVLAPLGLPNAIIGQPYSHQVTASNAPTSFSATGLPAGLTINSATGIISGSPTVSGAAFLVKVTASNSAGASAQVPDEMSVQAFPTGAIGVFGGLIPRHAGLNSNLGGKFSITTTSKATFTGTVTLGTTALAIKGPLQVAADVPTLGSAKITRRNLPDTFVEFAIDTVSRRLTGSITYQGDALPISAQAPGGKGTPYTGNYTLAMKLADADAGNDNNPRGYSFGAFKVASTTGTASGSLRLADNSTITFSSPVGVAGGFWVCSMLYANTGSLLAALSIDATDSFSLAGSQVSWLKKPQTAKVRHFREGFGPLPLRVLGRQYVIPAKDQIVMGLPPGPGNARLTFSGGRAPDPATRLNLTSFDIQKGSAPKIILPAVNPGKVTLRIVAGSGVTFSAGSTGSFTGAFTLKDADATTPKNTVLTRTATYYGMIANDGGGPRGYGFFLLPEMPALSPTRTTLGTSPYRSGGVLLESTAIP